MFKDLKENMVLPSKQIGRLVWEIETIKRIKKLELKSAISDVKAVTVLA